MSTIGHDNAGAKPLAERRVLVLVQGPLAQSPRMAAHARMLADAGAVVRLLGFAGVTAMSAPHPSVELVPLPGSGRDMAPAGGHPARRLLRAVGRAASMFPDLSRTLDRELAAADLLLAQVPPALPAVWLALARARRHGVPVALDWHNDGAALAALSFGPRHPLVRLVRRTERAMARRAALNLAVTDELARHLATEATIVLPDRPSAAPVVPVDRTRLLAALGLQLDPGRRWLLAVSPTSWSADEAMEMALDAASRLVVPPDAGLALVATGHGPRRTAFEARAAGLRRDGLAIATGWLDEADYRALVASADLGISLHASASGLDFPMKIVDMEGAGLPVLALDGGPALRTRLANLPDAVVFAGAAELANLLETRLKCDDAGRPVAPRGGETWKITWLNTALPALAAILRR